MKHHFLASTVCPSIISRFSTTQYSTFSLHSLPIGNVDCVAEEMKKGSSLQPKLEDNAQHIRRVILNIHNRTVEDVVQALKQNESCCKMQLTSCLVHGLLQKFGDDWKSALGFYQWANLQTGYKHTSDSCDKMVDLLGKMKQMDRMWDFVKEMQREGLVTLQTIARIMRRLTAAGKVKDAIKLFDDLGSLGFDKNTEAMNLLLDTLCKEKKVEIAREVYVNLKAHIPADAYTFHIFVNGWCNTRRIDEAMWTIQEMKGCGFHPSTITFSTIVQAYCNQCNFSKAFNLLNEMIATGCPPNVVTYTSIMHSLAKSRKFEEALSIVDTMKLSGCKPDALFYNSLIYTLGKSGRVLEASKIFWVEMQMNGVDRNLSTYNTMISIYCHHFQEQDAFDVLKEMGNSKCEPVLQTYFPLLKLCFKTGKIEDQLRLLLSEIGSKHHISFDLDTYTLLIHGLCSVGKIEWACLLFDEMISRDILPRARTLNVLMCEAEEKNMDEVVDRIKGLKKNRS